MLATVPSGYNLVGLSCMDLCIAACLVLNLVDGVMEQHLDITFRRDPTNYRPRINKLDSTKDREQKNAGSFYYLDD